MTLWTNTMLVDLFDNSHEQYQNGLATQEQLLRELNLLKLVYAVQGPKPLGPFEAVKKPRIH